MQLTKKGINRTSLSLRSAGFTLLEVMIAVSILSVGMLGVASMHLMSLKDNRDAYLRTQAILLTMDMSERMRNNKAQVYDNKYDNIDSSKISGAPNLSCFSPTTAACTPTNLTEIDKKQWSQKIRATDDNIPLIPKGVGTVTKVAGSNNIFTISISWQLEKSTASSYSIRVAI